MKFNTGIFALASIAFAYAKKDDITFVIDGVDTSKCVTFLEKFDDECNVQEINQVSDVDKICKTFNTEKCNSILLNGIASAPECQDIPKADLEFFDFDHHFCYTTAASSSYLQNFKESFYFPILGNSFGCGLDEKNNPCPLAKLTQDYLTTYKKPSKEDVDKALNESCSSKKCREDLIKYFNRFNNTEHELIFDKTDAEYLKVLKSDTCVSGKIQTASTSTSGATTVKVTGAFVVMAGLLLNALL